MKKLVAIIAIISAFGFSNIQASELEKSSSNEANQIELNILPYGKTDFVPMTPIYQSGEYTVYRVESDFVNTIPSCQPVGKNYHYFVYQNGEFMMTVNECNKDNVFSYLSK